MHSYIKVIADHDHNTCETFHFDDRIRDDIADAYVKAMVLKETTNVPTTTSMWRPPVSAGPWDELPLIGHRPKEAIESDLLLAQQQDDVVEMEARLSELTMLNSRYSRRGQS